MRLVATFPDQAKGYTLSTHLLNAGIDNQLEVVTNSDWGSNDYGTSTSRLWVIDEDQVAKAMEIVSEFENDPLNPKFGQENRTFFAKDPMPTSFKDPKAILKAAKAVQIEPMGIITLYSLIFCVLIYLVSAFTSPKFEEVPKNFPLSLVPLYSSPIYKELYFDYPAQYSMIDELKKKYGIDKLRDPSTLPPEGKAAYDKMLETHYWHGFYTPIVHYFAKIPNPPDQSNAPLFEKIKQGEIWRLFTPALLHSDILHLFFNMTWLAVLGRQMEHRLGSLRYLLFLLITGIVTNLAQYMMSGPNFIGFSGILCAMLTFIWVRQKKAAWEGYYLQDSTLGFILFFLLSLLGLQLISFYLEIKGHDPLLIAIANTAHITGLIIGALLGYTNFFSWNAGTKKLKD